MEVIENEMEIYTTHNKLSPQFKERSESKEQSNNEEINPAKNNQIKTLFFLMVLLVKSEDPLNNIVKTLTSQTEPIDPISRFNSHPHARIRQITLERV